MNWFVIAKHSDSATLRSVHNEDGSLIYQKDIPAPPTDWWFFHELDPGIEKPSGPMNEGVTCCMLYPDADQHVLACIYTHKPLAGYPRLYQVPPDDLPTEVRQGCYYDKEGRLYFPDRKSLDPKLQPIYGALAAAAPGTYSVETTMNDLLPKVRRVRGSDERVPGE